MPTYEYACRSCGHTFEIVQSMSDEPLTECPECHGELRKVFAPPAISFKGSGFYATDHGKKAKETTEASPDKGEGKGGKDAKGDSAKKRESGSSSSGSKEGSSSGSSPSGGSGSSKKEATSS